MPKVNLLPREELITKPLGRFLKWAFSYGRYIIISVELVVFLIFFSRFIYDRQLNDLNDVIEQKQSIIASAADFEKRFRGFQDKINYINQLDTNRSLYLDTITLLKQITPGQVSYDTVSFSDYSLSLTGSASTNESFAQYLAQLKKTEDFTSIALENLSKEEDSEEITFTVSITFARPEVPIITGMDAGNLDEEIIDEAI